ncbi:MAG: putative porin [Rikenellaceae bacterium]
MLRFITKQIYLRLFLAVIAITVLSSYTLHAQITSTGNSTIDEIYNNGVDSNITNITAELEGQPTDSLGKKDKEEKERKPLESYLFSDSIKALNVFSWMHNPYTNNIKMIPVDTMLVDFQKDYLFMQDEKVGSAYNGNLGGASIALDYFNRADNRKFAFLNAYNDYLYRPDNVPYYNSKVPFTQLTYFMSGQTSRAEQQLRVTHAQTISPSSSFNLTYRNNGTKGMYNSQAATEKNFSTAFDHTGKKYTFHGGYIYNMGDIDENGGLTEDFFVTDTLVDLPQNLPTNLVGANNTFRSNTFYFTQSYGMPFRRLSEDMDDNIRDKSAIFFGHALELTSMNRTYTDDVTYVEDGFYDNWYINPSSTVDSIYERNFDTRFFTQIQPYSRDGILSVFGGGIGYDYESYYYFKPDDYIYGNQSTSKSSVYIFANAEGKLKKYLSWDGSFKYVPIGYRSQDMELKGNMDAHAYLSSRLVNLSANVLYRMESPSFWSEQYYSNHYMWNNSFSKEIETRLEAKLSIPSYGIELGAKQSVTTNKIYFDANSLPAQYNDALSVSAIYLQKDFRLGGLNLKNRVLLQWSSSQEVAPVPAFSANGIYYYEFNVVKGVLRMQLGIEGYYNSSYYGFGYNPALMQFYNQRSVETGDYLWADAFVSGKWKRVRFLVKYQHANYEMFGDRNYFQIAHYPLNRSMLKMGISWNFYD